MPITAGGTIVKSKFFAAGLTGILFLLLIFLLLNFDVAPIGPQGTSIGLSMLNQSVFDYFGVNDVWQDITDGIGYMSILVAVVFALFGALQLVQRKSIWKVDKSLLALGALYLVTVGFYGLFEAAVVNYRPIVMPGDTEPEASFPSSHTMLTCVILGSTAMLLERYVGNRAARLTLQVLCTALILIMAGGRLAAGIHWFTDILGGLLLSATLLLMYAGLLEKLEGSAAEQVREKAAGKSL
jgi:undecaprenyl-diphosphatase